MKKIKVKIQPTKKLYLKQGLFSLSAEGGPKYEFFLSIPATLILLKTPKGDWFKLTLQELGAEMIEAIKS